MKEETCSRICEIIFNIYRYSTCIGQWQSWGNTACWKLVLECAPHTRCKRSIIEAFQNILSNNCHHFEILLKTWHSNNHFAYSYLPFPAGCWGIQIPTEWTPRTLALCSGRHSCVRSGTPGTWLWTWFSRTRQWSSSSQSLTTSSEQEPSPNLFGPDWRDVLLQLLLEVRQKWKHCNNPCRPIRIKADFTLKDNYRLQRTWRESC